MENIQGKSARVAPEPEQGAWGLSLPGELGEILPELKSSFSARTGSLQLRIPAGGKIPGGNIIPMSPAPSGAHGEGLGSRDEVFGKRLRNLW